MPRRPLNREQPWLFPPTLEEVVPEDHPVRFVAEFVDALERSGWSELGVEIDGEALGAPSYHPRGLLSVWLYGFMTGVRSCRKLEAACRDQIPYLWLTAWQHPDHNTLWRFYRDHRGAMRRLFKRTVRTMVAMGLVELAVQAVDGTKIAANAAKDRSFDAEGLQRLLRRVDAAISDLEAQNEAGEDAVSVCLPEELAKNKALREQVQQAMEQLAGEEGQQRINLTDGDASLMKAGGGIVAAYNAQAMVSPLEPGAGEGTGLVITAAEVVCEANDSGQLTPMLEQAEEMIGDRAEATLADAGYHSGANLESCAQREQQVIMPESQHKALEHPYHKDRFCYDEQMEGQLHQVQTHSRLHRSLKQPPHLLPISLVEPPQGVVVRTLSPAQPQKGYLFPTRCLQLPTRTHPSHESVQPRPKQRPGMIGRRSHQTPIHVNPHFQPLLTTQPCWPRTPLQPAHPDGLPAPSHQDWEAVSKIALDPSDAGGISLGPSSGGCHFQLYPNL